MNISSLSGITKAVVALSAGGVLAGAIALGASGGNGGGASPPAQVAAATATSVPEAPPTVTAARGPLVARSDCPRDWTYYNDPDGHFSFCHPSDLKATQGEGVPGGSKGVSVNTVQDAPPPSQRPNSITFTIYWKPDSAFQRGLLPDRCKTARDSFAATTREEVKATARRQATACAGNGRTAYHGVDPVSLELPDNFDGGYVQIFMFQSGPDVGNTTQILDMILDSVRLHGEP